MCRHALVLPKERPDRPCASRPEGIAEVRETREDLGLSTISQNAAEGRHLGVANLEEFLKLVPADAFGGSERVFSPKLNSGDSHHHIG